jgi:hypothetical protein
LLVHGDITVDDHFARFGSKSFAINKINSVEVRSTTKAGSNSYAVWWGLALLLGLPALFTPEARPGLVFAALFALLGWRSWRRRRPVTTYRLFLVTSSAEAQAFETNDEDEVIRLRAAIEDAMARAS